MSTIYTVQDEDKRVIAVVDSIDAAQAVALDHLGLGPAHPRRQATIEELRLDLLVGKRSCLWVGDSAEITIRVWTVGEQA